MADVLKEFSNLTGKTLTELTAGVTLVSTDGSKKAVIKGIAVENPKGRAVDIRLNSKTGTKIAGAGATKTLGGNEILDNSQSLVASTDSELVLNRFDVVGWYEGQYSTGSSSNDFDFNTRKQVIMSHSTPKGPMFTPNSWDTAFPSTPDVAVAFPKLTGTTADFFLENNIKDSFFDKDGNMWFWGAGGCGNIEYMSTYSGNQGSLGNQMLHRMRPGAYSGAITSYGSSNDARIMFYDGSRYIYTGKHGETKLRKYDTHTIGTSNTYTDLNLYADNSGSTALTLQLEPAAAGCYYHSSGFAAIYGYGGSVSDGRAFRIIDLSTGRTKALHDNNYDYLSMNGYTGTGSQRRSLALVENTAGELWAIIGNWHNNTNNTSARNGWSLTNLGTDPAACLADNGTFVDTKYFNTYSLAGNDASWANYIRQKSAGDGNGYFGNPRGMFAHTPNVKRYLTLIGNKYQRTDTQSTYARMRLDFDNISSSYGWFEHKSGAFKAGCYRAVYDTNEAETSFGTVNFRTTGIEVT